MKERRCTLDEWIDAEGLTNTEFADLVGADNGTISRWRRGVTIPRPEDMLRIYEATCGEVEPNSFYDLPKVA
jgi:transcriptional regulator with XRE-family HTH domain